MTAPLPQSAVELWRAVLSDGTPINHYSPAMDSERDQPYLAFPRAEMERLLAEREALRGLLGEARVAVEMASRGEWPVDPHERKKYDALLARINTMFGEK